jgi:hypothetical protein
MVFSEIKEFAAENPQLQVVAREVKKNVHPHLHGVFGISMRRSARALAAPASLTPRARARAHTANGSEQVIPLHKKSRSEVVYELNRLRDRSGRKLRSLRRWHVARLGYPSVQGPWRPDLFPDTQQQYYKSFFSEPPPHPYVTQEAASEEDIPFFQAQQREYWQRVLQEGEAARAASAKRLAEGKATMRKV